LKAWANVTHTHHISAFKTPSLRLLIVEDEPLIRAGIRKDVSTRMPSANS
jgi:hypothetical protein